MADLTDAGVIARRPAALGSPDGGRPNPLYRPRIPDIPLPVNEPERTFPLDFAENLLGRRSDRKDIHPEIPAGDPESRIAMPNCCANPTGALCYWTSARPTARD